MPARASGIGRTLGRAGRFRRGETADEKLAGAAALGYANQGGPGSRFTKGPARAFAVARAGPATVVCCLFFFFWGVAKAFTAAWGPLSTRPDGKKKARDHTVCRARNFSGGPGLFISIFRGVSGNTTRGPAFGGPQPQTRGRCRAPPPNFSGAAG